MIADSAHDLKWKHRLRISKKLTYSESIHEFVKWETVVLRWFGDPLPAARP